MRAHILITIALLAPGVAFCYDKKKNKGIPVSRWREEKRMSPDSAIVPIPQFDTLFISFQRRDSFSYHNGPGFLYVGGYSVSEDSILDFGTVRYKLVDRRPNRLVLANENGIYQLGIDHSDTARIITIDSEKIQPVTDIDMMIGHWSVYKRTTKDTGSTIDNAKAIKAIYITGPSTDGKLGYVFGGRDPINAPSWYIREYSSDQTMTCDGGSLKTLKVKKCQHGEMIIEEDDITYYLKQYK